MPPTMTNSPLRARGFSHFPSFPFLLLPYTFANRTTSRPDAVSRYHRRSSRGPIRLSFLTPPPPRCGSATQFPTHRRGIALEKRLRTKHSAFWPNSPCSTRFPFVFPKNRALPKNNGRQRRSPVPRASFSGGAIYSLFFPPTILPNQQETVRLSRLEVGRLILPFVVFPPTLPRVQKTSYELGNQSVLIEHATRFFYLWSS